MPPTLRLTVLDGQLSVARLAADAPVPGWVPTTGFTTVSRTEDELSIVCASEAVGEGTQHVEPGWAGLKLEGPFDFELTGILAAVLVPLAEAGIGIFALSTFDTDYVLVKHDVLDRAVAALGEAGHQVTRPG